MVTLSWKRHLKHILKHYFGGSEDYVPFLVLVDSRKKSIKNEACSMVLFIRYANDNLIFIQYMYLILEELKSFCSSLKCTFYNHKIKLVDHRYGHHSEKKHDL